MENHTNNKRRSTWLTIAVVVVGMVACNADRAVLDDAGSVLTDLGSSLRDSASDSAMAAPTDCDTWEVMSISFPGGWDYDTPEAMPAGWEPFSIASGNFYVRRCAP